MTELLRAASFHAWAMAILRVSLVSGVALLAVGLTDVMLARRVSARWRAVLYLAVLVRVLLPSDWASPVGLLSREVVQPRATASVSPVATSRVAASPAPAVSLAPSRLPVAAPWQMHGAVAGALLLAWAAVRRAMTRSLRGAGEASPRVRALAPGHRVVEDARRGPAVFGLLEPRIVVPSGLVASLDDAMLAAVLRHEAAHVSRRDTLRLAAVQVFTFACWPILPAWIAACRLRGLMEQACDEQALRGASPQERRAYGEALLRVAEWRPLPARIALGMLPFGGGLEARLSALGATRRWSVMVQLGAVGLAAVSVVLASGSRNARAADGSASAAAAPTTASADAATRLEVTAWIVDEETAAAAWPGPRPPPADAPTVPVAHALFGLPAPAIEALRAGMEAAVERGTGRRLGHAAVDAVPFTSAGRISLGAAGIPHELDLELTPRSGVAGPTADVRLEWGGIRTPPQPPGWGGRPDSRFLDSTGAALPGAVATRLADGTSGVVILEARGPVAAAPRDVVRGLLEAQGCAAGIEDADPAGTSLIVLGSCPTPRALAEALRSLEGRADLADVALQRMVDGGARTVFELTVRARQRGAVRVTTQTWQVGAVELDRLVPPPAGAPSFASLAAESAAVQLHAAALRPGGLPALRVAVAPLVVEGRAKPLAQGAGHAVTGERLRVAAGALGEARHLDLGVTPELGATLRCEIDATWDSGRVSARGELPAIGVLALGRGDFLLVAIEGAVPPE